MTSPPFMGVISLIELGKRDSRWIISPLLAYQHWLQHRLEVPHTLGDHCNWLPREGTHPTVHVVHEQ